MSDSSDSKSEKVVFTHEDPQFLEDEGYEVVETYDLADGEYAALIRVSDFSVLDQDERIDDSEDNKEEFETLDKPEAVDGSFDRLATIEEVRNLHNCPAKGPTGKGVTVVVMDSGIDQTHPLFKDADIKHIDATSVDVKDDVGHGTACAGQVHRLAPDATILNLPIFGNKGRTSMDIILQAYQWLLNNTDKYDIVNMSWGASRKVKKIDNLQNKLVEKGVRDVTASGNTGGKPGSPATADKSFSVGATDERGKMTDFSSAHPKKTVPEVSAIGKNCRLAKASGTNMGKRLQGPWVKASGTSFAAPEAAGMKAKFMELHTEGVAGAFKKGARDIKGTERDGHGLADYKGAIETKPDKPDEPEKPPEKPEQPPEKPEEPPEEPNYPEPIDSTKASVWSFIGKDTIFFGKDWLKSGDHEAELLEDKDDEKVVRFKSK